MLFQFAASPKWNWLATLILFLATLMLPLTVLAQDSTEGDLLSYTTPDGSLNLEYPEDWYITLDDTQELLPADVIILANGDLESEAFFTSEESLLILIVPPSDFNRISDLRELPSSPRDLIELAVFAPDADMFGEIETITLNRHSAVYTNFENGSLSGQIIVIDLGKGDLGIILAMSLTGDYQQHSESVFTIVESMSFIPSVPIEFGTIDSEEMGISVDLPPDYVYNDSYSPGILYLGTNDDVVNSPAPSTGEFTGFVADERFFAIELGMDGDDLASPEDVLNTFAEVLVGRNSVELETIDIEDAAISEIVQFSIERPANDMIVMAFEVPDKGLMLAVFLMNSGELADLHDTVIQIVTSIAVLEDDAPKTDN